MAVRTLQNKITAWWIPDRKLIHFQNFPKVLEELKDEFESRFNDVTVHKEIFNFHVDASSLTPTITQLCPGNRAALESEIIELQTNTIFQLDPRAGVGHF